MFGGWRRPGRAASRPAAARPGVARKAWRWGWRQTAAAAALALVAGACVAVQVASVPPASAAATVPTPAGWWQFNEGSGTTTADSSGNGHTGTLGVGATWAAPGVGAHSIATNGTAAGNVTVSGPVVNTSASYTVSAWVNLTSTGGGNQTFVGINGLASPTGTTISGFYLQYQGGSNNFAFTLRASDATGSAITQAVSSTLANAGTWYHLVGVYNLAAQTIALYVNGALQATTAFTTPWQATGNTTIGQGMYGGGAVDFVSGKIDDVALYSAALSAAQVAVLNQPVIAAGYTTSCMISSGNAYCWGDGSTGTLGDGSTVNSSVPVPVYTGGVLSGLTLTQISVGSDFACALSSAGAAYCWGLGTSGQLGNGASVQSNVPVAVSGGLTFTQIDTGAAFACGLTSAGAAYCWGAGNQGQLGNGTTTAAQNTPVAVTTTGTPLAGVTLTQISTGTSFACALSGAGAAYCWGKNQAGQLGNGTTTTPQDTATAVTTTGTPLAGVTLTQINAALGGSTACALSSAGAAYCWGDDTLGELGNGITTSTPQTTAVAVTTTGALSGVTLTQITAGHDQVCALSAVGTSYCWGGNTDGDLGNGSTTLSNVAVAVSTSGVLSGKVVTGLSAGGNFLTCALDTFGTPYCWGLNSLGQAGNADTAVNFTVPATVAPSQPTTSRPGPAHSCEIRTGKAFCWGDNSKGELGNNTTISSSVPVAAYTGGALSGVPLTQISAGNTFTCALSSAGAAYCWGLGTSGQLGNDTTVTSGAPVAVVHRRSAVGGDPNPDHRRQQLGVRGVQRGRCLLLGTETPAASWETARYGRRAPAGGGDDQRHALSGATVTQVSTGNGSACAVGSTGTAYCWGLTPAASWETARSPPRRRRRRR